MNNILTAMPWRRLAKIGKPFWVSEKNSVGFTNLGLILTLMAAKAGVAVCINVTSGHFMTAMEQKSWSDFWLYLFLSILAILITVPIETYYNLLRTRLALYWRDWLSRSLIHKYFSHAAGIKVENSREIDNPEQRMTQDVDSFCGSSIRLAISILDALVTVCTFMIVLWKISPSLSFIVIVYSTLGLVIVSHIGKTLISISDRQMKTEADLRAKLASARDELVRTNSSSTTTVAEAELALTAVISNLLDMTLVHKNLQLFTGVFNHLVPLIPPLIVAHLYFNDHIPFGTITQAVMAFTSVFQGATILIGQFADLSHYAAIINRIGSLTEALEAPNEEVKLTQNNYLQLDMFNDFEAPELEAALVGEGSTFFNSTILTSKQKC